MDSDVLFLVETRTVSRAHCLFSGSWSQIYWMICHSNIIYYSKKLAIVVRQIFNFEMLKINLIL
jgi:hypothetical protein